MKKEIEIPEEFMTEELEAIAAESEDAENAKAPEAENTADGDKTVPLAALQRERERVRALKREAEETGRIVKRLLEETGLGSVEALQARMDELSLQNFMQKRGVDSEVARMIQQQQEEIKNLKKLQKRGEKDVEIRALRENPLYSDIDEVLETVSEYADEKGLSVKEAYNAMFGEERAKKLRAAAREEALSEAKNRQGKKIPALSSVGNAPSEGKDGAKLSAEEIGWAQMAGLTPDEYAKYKH